MIDLTLYLPAKRKTTANGWISFNAPCCVHNGESADTRQRGGMRFDSQSWSYHCFNCQYKTGFTPGRPLAFKARLLLQWLNIPAEEIERINLESMRVRSVEGLLASRPAVNKNTRPVFAKTDIPADVASEIVTLESAAGIWQYLRTRAAPLDYPFLVANTARPAVVIPFTADGEIVGYSTHYLDGKKPKYVNNTQHGYVFGIDLQQNNWQYAIVVEGIFDALSIDALAILHAEINDAQVALIRSLGKQVIVVPDQDHAGLQIVDRAIELGWAVSMPDWEQCKDCNDAVKKYGKLPVLLSIINSAETNRLKIQLRKRELLRRLASKK